MTTSAAAAVAALLLRRRHGLLSCQRWTCSLAWRSTRPQSAATPPAASSPRRAWESRRHADMRACIGLAAYTTSTMRDQNNGVDSAMQLTFYISAHA